MSHLLADSTLPLDVWDYGLSIGVITVLFLGIYYLFNHFTKANKEQAEAYLVSSREQASEFTSTLQVMTAEHKSERDEWRSDSNKREERAMKVCDELIRTIHENKSNQ